MLKKLITLILLLLVVGALVAISRNNRIANEMLVPKAITLSVGEKVSISDFSITFNKFIQDSRCPIDVQCIQAGAVNVNVTMQVGANSVTKNFPSDEVPQEFEGYKISIVDVLPKRMSKKEINPNDYKITFQIEQ